MGVTVAIIDTGLSLDGLKEAIVIPGINLSGERSEYDTTDGHGHGTAIASTILGLAPRSAILPIKLMTDCGYLRLPDRLEVAFEWIFDRHKDLNIGVVCAAFADGSHASDDEAYRGSRLQGLIATLRAAGVATVAPAGNHYQQNRIWAEQGMAWPAILREVISAGAITLGQDFPVLHPTTQRLQALAGCGTTIFVEPGPPGNTSGAAAVVAGYLAALKLDHPQVTVDAMVKQLLQCQSDIMDEQGLTWPCLKKHCVEFGKYSLHKTIL
jgi:subtilisin family serine protease